MSTDTTLARINIPEAISLSERLAKTTMVPKAFQGRPADVLAIMLKGAELGLPPMASLAGVMIIEGKTGLSAELMASLVKAASVTKLFQLTESTDAVATYQYQRQGMPEPKLFSFTIKQAQAAGLAGKDVWKKYPAAMLRARCISALCKAEFQDVVNGVYETTSGEFQEVIGRVSVAPLEDARKEWAEQGRRDKLEALPLPTKEEQQILDPNLAIELPKEPEPGHDAETGEVSGEEVDWAEHIRSGSTIAERLRLMKDVPAHLKAGLSKVLNEGLRR